MSRDDWRTPPELFAWAESTVGGFSYDAACTWDNQLAPAMWTLGGFAPRDSLSHQWPDNATIWCNPPYSDIDPWIDRALECNSLVAMLIMSPNGEERFDRLIPQSHEIHIVGRIAFLDANGKPAAGNTRGSSLFLINPPFGEGQRTIRTRNLIYGKKLA